MVEDKVRKALFSIIKCWHLCKSSVDGMANNKRASGLHNIVISTFPYCPYCIDGKHTNLYITLIYSVTCKPL